MTSTISDAVRRGPSAASHLVRTHELYPHVKSGELTLRKSQVAVVHRRTTMAVFNSATIPTNGFSNAGFADISLSGADIISGITLRLTYANNTGAQLNQWKARWAWYIFDHLDILAENGSVVLERLEPEHLSKSWHELPPAAHERVKEGLQSGFDSNATGNPPATNDGTSTTLYFPLLGCSLATQEIPPFALSSPIIIRCYFRGSAVFTGPYTAQMIPNGPPTITAFDAITTAYQLDASERNDLARRYAMAGLRSSPPLDIRMARPGFQKTQETFSGGTLHTIRLSSVQGLVTSMAVILQKIDSQGFGYGLYYPPHRVDLLDEKGSSLFGQPLDYNLLQVTQALTDGGTHDFNLNKLLALPIGGFSGEASGQIHGYVPMSGNHQLQVQADAGDYTVTIIYRTVAHMRVERAHLTVHSS